MELMNILLSGMIFECDSKELTFQERMAKINMYNKSNDVGNSNYKTFLTDPQPEPTLLIDTQSKEFCFAPQIPSIIGTNSINYADSDSKKLTGGIVGLNSSEMDNFVIKHKF